MIVVCIGLDDCAVTVFTDESIGVGKAVACWHAFSRFGDDVVVTKTAFVRRSRGSTTSLGFGLCNSGQERRLVLLLLFSARRAIAKEERLTTSLNLWRDFTCQT